MFCNVLVPIRDQNSKNSISSIVAMFVPIFEPIIGTKILQNYFYLVEEVLSFGYRSIYIQIYVIKSFRIRKYFMNVEHNVMYPVI